MKMHPSNAKRICSVLLGMLMLLSAFIYPLAGNASNSLSAIQRNSIGMMNYLMVLSQEIRASHSSRLYLEEAYSSLINNINPNAVETETLQQLNNILDTLEDYRMISVKRDRLTYIYEQNMAQAMYEALPSPVGLLALVQQDLPRHGENLLGKPLFNLASTIAFLAFDSYSSYSKYVEAQELEHLMHGWDLDDDEQAVLHQSRKDMFNYMVLMVNEHNLPGDLALNEKSVEEFVAWKNNENIVQRIHFLENNRAQYQTFGAYWLLLAESYFANGDDAKCLQAIDQYEELNSQIHRKDFDYAAVLPLGIAAGERSLSLPEYEERTSDWVEIILKNTENGDWSLRYFVAQTYIDLYVKTLDKAYLQNAFSVILDNVNTLVNTQRKQNQEYLASLVEVKVPKDAPGNTKTEIENYNKQMRKDRETALAPVYEPLRLNCDLLFALAEQLQIPESEKVKINNILRVNDSELFLIPSLDARYRFDGLPPQVDEAKMEVAYNGRELQLPAKFFAGDAQMSVTITEPGDVATTVITDWQIRKVDRKNQTKLDSFVVTFFSPSAEKHSYTLDSKVHVEVKPKAGIEEPAFVFDFAAYNTKDQWWKNVEFWSSGIGFERVVE